ncbi:13709_t:CDS:2, partial [Dentiscutata heterogama]
LGERFKDSFEHEASELEVHPRKLVKSCMLHRSLYEPLCRVRSVEKDLHVYGCYQGKSIVGYAHVHVRSSEMENLHENKFKLGTNQSFEDAEISLFTQELKYTYGETASKRSKILKSLYEPLCRVRSVEKDLHVNKCYQGNIYHRFLPLAALMYM